VIRRLLPGVVTRNVASTLICNTIFGNQTVIKYQCSCCGKFLPLSAFYLESDSKKKFVDQPRTQCVDCWDLLKGKTPKASHPPTNNLETFMEEKHA